MQATLTRTDLSLDRYAGLLYLIIIICGIGAEVGLRGPLLNMGSAETTAEAILAASGSFRLAIVADIVMALSDAGLAILLFLLFRPVSPGLALAALIFRLVQAVLISANLLNMQAAWLLVSGGQDISGFGPGQADAMALAFLNLHAHGYDLGLVFFGINSLLMGALIWRSGFVPRLLGVGIVAAGIVYLTGSTLRFLAPEAFQVFSPAYGITLLAEAAICLWLLLAGRTPRRAHAAA